MTAYQPFAIDRVFGAASRAEQRQVDSDLLEQLLAEAEARGRAAGEEAALDRLRSEKTLALEEAARAIRESIAGLGDQLRERTDELQAEATELVLVAAEHLAGRALETHPAAAIDAAIGAALEELRRGVALDVRVHPDLVADVQALLAERQAGDRRRLNVHVAGDAALELGDARLTWQGGGALLDRAARRAAVERELVQNA